MSVSIASDLSMALDICRFSRAVGIDPDAAQEELLTTASRRVLVNACRQFGKSTTTAVRAAREIIYHCNSLVVVVSPSQPQSTELFKKIHDIWEKAPGAPASKQETLTRMELANGSRVISLPGSERTVRGFSGASLVIADECARIDDELIAAVMPMLATTDGQFVGLSTPKGRRGFFFDKWTDGGDLWKRIAVPASECPRISPTFLEEQRQTLGPLQFAQEYELQFIDTGASAFMSQLIEQAMSTDFPPFMMEALR
jgi:hypothetical protein